MKKPTNFSGIIILTLIVLLLVTCTSKPTTPHNHISGIPIGLTDRVLVKDNYPYRYFLGGNKFRKLELVILEYYGSETKVDIPEKINGWEVTRIHHFAFAMKELTEVTLPETIWYIGAGAFANNKLTNITISENVEFIGRFAFHGNPLEVVTIKKDANRNYAFPDGYVRSSDFADYATLGSLTATYQMNGGLSGVYTLEDTGWKLNGSSIKNYTSLLHESGYGEREGIRILIDSIDESNPRQYIHRKNVRLDFQVLDPYTLPSTKYTKYTWYYMPVGEHTIVSHYYSPPSFSSDTTLRSGDYSNNFRDYLETTYHQSDGFSSPVVTTTRVFGSDNYSISYQNQKGNDSFHISVTPLSSILSKHDRNRFSGNEIRYLIDIIEW